VVAHTAWGAALLVAATTANVWSRQPTTTRSVRTFATVLGGRHLLQAAAMAPRPTRRQLKFGALVDAIHGATMVGLALGDIGPRRLTFANATTAGMFAVAERARSSCS
jgi:hypothetical protein